MLIAPSLMLLASILKPTKFGIKMKNYSHYLLGFSFLNLLTLLTVPIGRGTKSATKFEDWGLFFAMRINRGLI